MLDIIHPGGEPVAGIYHSPGYFGIPSFIRLPEASFSQVKEKRGKRKDYQNGYQ
jgi:hypothetical protein